MALRHLGEAHVAGDRRDRALVLRVAPGVHEDDRHSVEILRLRIRQRGPHGLGIRRGLDRSVGVQALVDFDDRRIELLGLLDGAGENLRPRLVADLERVAEAARRDQQRALAAPLEQSVGRDCRAHFDDADGARRNRRVLV